MTLNVIPILAKNAITQEVHPYVNMPNKTEREPNVDDFPSLPFKITMAVDKFINNALPRDMITFVVIFKITKYRPYWLCISI